jgi:hypothetical protein
MKPDCVIVTTNVCHLGLFGPHNSGRTSHNSRLGRRRSQRHHLPALWAVMLRSFDGIRS